MSTTTINRDKTTGAILNTDASALNKYKVERNFYRKVDRIQTDLLDIKKSILDIYERIEKLEEK
jgi:peptidoglycan hydrolase CwlO-like protein